ncbi:MAG: competence/damage-inducible protein A, partial [Deltaproteobacteria bacterium]|nr:competence/damage-inducible protein A [Deltaproteobacteria bacterium]
GALGLSSDEIMVTDATGDTLTLDILVPTLPAERIIGRKRVLLDALRKVPGLRLTDDTDVHSDGVLGLIGLGQEIGEEVLQRTRALAGNIAAHIQKRAVIYPTGTEVLNGQIRDANSPFLEEALRGRGMEAVIGPVLDDDSGRIARAFKGAAEDGFGLLITTGGIGAEGKDKTLEALESVDPEASMPYILKFRKGEGRHHRDGVRIGVGYLEPTRIVCLPGPHDEVRLAWPMLRQGLREGWSKEALADALAGVLRNKFLLKSRDANRFHSTTGEEHEND